MKIKTSEATEQQLDWAVAFCENQTLGTEQYNVLEPLEEGQEQYSPSTNWSQGGPIIEREKIDLYQSTGRNAAAIWENLPGGGRLIAESKDTPTILTAAMRCYVASKLGDEVEIPNELTGE